MHVWEHVRTLHTLLYKEFTPEQWQSSGSRLTTDTQHLSQKRGRWEAIRLTAVSWRVCEIPQRHHGNKVNATGRWALAWGPAST